MNIERDVKWLKEQGLVDADDNPHKDLMEKYLKHLGPIDAAVLKSHLFGDYSKVIRIIPKDTKVQLTFRFLDMIDKLYGEADGVDITCYMVVCNPWTDILATPQEIQNAFFKR